MTKKVKPSTKSFWEKLGSLFEGSNKAPKIRSSPTAGMTSEMRKQEIFRQVLEEKKKEDPFIGLVIGANEVNNRLFRILQDERGVHIETVLSSVGSLAGYACQASVREEIVKSKGLKDEDVFHIVEGADGNKYFFGDLLNKPLAEDELSVWSLVAGMLKQLGNRDLPELRNIFEHVANTVGTKEFGMPRIPEDHTPADKPENLLKLLWPAILPVLQDCSDKPSEWPTLLGIATQKMIENGKDVIDPGLAALIAMESAIPMSKIDLLLEK